MNLFVHTVILCGLPVDKSVGKHWKDPAKRQKDWLLAFIGRLPAIRLLHEPICRSSKKPE